MAWMKHKNPATARKALSVDPGKPVNEYAAFITLRANKANGIGAF
jgi:hypothetical protein